MIGRNLREDAAVIDQAADRNAAEADAVIAFLAAQNHGAGALTDGALIGNGDFQRRIDRFRTGIGEEYAVELCVRSTRRYGGELFGEVEGHVMAHLEGGREIHGGNLTFDGLRDLLAAMACIAAPKTRRTVEHLIAIDIGVIHARSACEQAGSRLELPVRRERHPEILKAWRVGFGEHRILLFAAAGHALRQATSPFLKSSSY